MVHAESQWKKVLPDVSFSFPRDHGAHPDSRTEWWYVTGITQDENQRTFGYQLTFFRQGIDPSAAQPGESSMRARQIIAAHFAIADIENQAFHHTERVRRAAYLAGAATDDLRVWLDDWRIERDANGVIAMTANDAEAGIAIDFQLTAERPFVLQGKEGYSQKGEEPGNASGYITWTRLRTQGVLQLDGERFDVEGMSWFDHEFGTSQLGEGVQGWDWFGLRLDDGRDLMVYQLRTEDGGISPYSAGNLILQDGTNLYLQSGDFSIEAYDSWTSPKTEITYPIGWRIKAPEAGIDIQAEPLLPNAEMNTGISTGTVYWEGPVRLSGSVTGEGYAELTGYSESIGGRFE